MPSPPRKTALLIGNGRFEDRKLSVLSAPSADVEALRRVLEDRSIGGFGDVKVLNDATFAEASAAIGNLFDVASSDDTILLYYSGHGLLDQSGHLYLATRGTPAESPAGTSIAAAEIKRLMGSSRSLRQVLILDCCYSGAFGAAKGRAELPIGAETFTTGFGHHVLTASRSVERAYEGEQELEGVDTSLFTHFLVHGLMTGEAAREGEEIVYVGDLYEYAFEGVTKLTNKMQPQMWINQGQGALAIARNPKPYQLPEDLDRMRKSTSRFEREGAVRMLGAWLHGPEPKERAVAAKVLEALNEKEENRYVADAIKEVLLLRPTTTGESAATDEPPATDETAATDEAAAADETTVADKSATADESAAPIRADRAERKLTRLRLVAGFAFVLAIGALAAAFYLESELAIANVRSNLAEQALNYARVEVREVTAERDDAQAALTRVTDERDEARVALAKVTDEHDETRASLDAFKHTVAALKEELSARSRQDVLDRVRATLALDAAERCVGEVVDGTGFKCPMDDEWGPVMLAIPSGSFTMGSPDNETDRNPDESQRVVQIEKPFAIGKYEVTFDEYKRFARPTGRETPDDYNFGEGRRPVIDVSWHDAKAYAEWLSATTGQRYRLPTEAEWEYAARAGTTGPFSFTGPISPKKANYNASRSYADSETGERSNQTEEVGSFSRHANRWGLNDVHGNVWEWVENCYGRYAKAPTNGTAEPGSFCDIRVMRGGGWLWPPEYMRSASRSHQVAGLGFQGLGISSRSGPLAHLAFLSFSTYLLGAEALRSGWNRWTADPVGRYWLDGLSETSCPKRTGRRQRRRPQIGKSGGNSNSRPPLQARRFPARSVLPTGRPELPTCDRPRRTQV